MKKIAIIGAGNIGSRHLQALKAIDVPLKIIAVDPNPESLAVSKQRYDAMPMGTHEHQLSYIEKIKDIKDPIDIAIIATNSDLRRRATEQLLEITQVDYVILEKVLFQKPEDYTFIEDLFRAKNCKAWVNFIRRMIPTYRDLIKAWFNKKRIYYSVSGSNFELISNIIHHVDYMSYLVDNTEFTVDTSHLTPELVESKRTGFFDINGYLSIHFSNGSHGSFACYPPGNLLEIILIDSDTERCIINQLEQSSWVWKNSKWETFNAYLTNNSELTTSIITEIINTDNCSLTPYNDAKKIHLNFLNPLLKFINKNSEENYNYFPFT